MKLEPGQVLIGRKELSRVLKMSERNTRTALGLLKTTGITTSETTNHFSVITLVKWVDYQGQPHKVTTETTGEVTNTRPTPDQQPTTEQEVENVRIQEKPSSDAKTFKDHLWEKLQTKGKPIWPNFKWIPEKINSLIGEVGCRQAMAWVDNYIADPFVKSWTVQGFLSEPDKYQKRRETFGESAKIVRASEDHRRRMEEMGGA